MGVTEEKTLRRYFMLKDFVEVLRYVQGIPLSAKEILVSVDSSVGKIRLVVSLR